MKVEIFLVWGSGHLQKLGAPVPRHLSKACMHFGYKWRDCPVVGRFTSGIPSISTNPQLKAKQ